MHSLITDLRYAWRKLFNGSGGTLVAILSIGFGVGVSTAIFGAVDQLLLAALPYPESERVVAISDRTPDGEPLAVAYGSYIEISQRSRSFDALAVADRWQPSLVAGGEPARLEGDLVSPDYFRVLGVGPAVGRDFEEADDIAAAPRVAIVSASFAKRRFGSVEAMLDQRISLDGEEHAVIGVMPEGFENALSPEAEVWAPRRFRAQAPFESTEWGHHMRMVGRLGAGVGLERAQRDLASIAANPVAEFARPPWASLVPGLAVESLQVSVTKEVRPALLALFGAVLLLLAIACANVTNILLARALARRGELAMRAALGAPQGRLVRQLFTESALLTFIGGAFGIGIAAVAGRALLALAPDALPRVETMHFDARLFAFALAITAAFAIVVGLVPALRARHGGSRIDLSAGARATPAGLQWLRRSLVVVQVALATVLLASAGLLLRSVERLLDVPTGFDASGVMALQIAASGDGPRSDEEALVLFERALEAVRAVPGAVDVALTTQLPLSGDSDVYGVAYESSGNANPRGEGGAFRYVVTPSWFKTMRIPLVRGRLLGAEDRPGAPPAVLINESFAARRFAGRDPIGERVRMGPDITRPDRPWATIVGVVGDVKQTSLATASPDAFYMAMGQWSWVDEVQSLVVRTGGDPTSLVEPIKQAIWSVDPTLPLVRITTVADLVARSEAQRTFALTLFGAFGLAALLLAGVGVYGVVEGRVVERTREIGVRSALGASPTELAALVVRQGMTLTGIGIAIGIVASFGATQALATLLFGVAPFDPLTYAGVVALLFAVAFAACYAPAARATRIDPAITLRAD
jgi:putative ABC transport system permease protein